MELNDKIDIVLTNVAADLSSIAPRKTTVHVEDRDGTYTVVTDADDLVVGVIDNDNHAGPIDSHASEYDVEIRSVRQTTPDKPVGQVVVRLRKKAKQKEHQRIVYEYAEETIIKDEVLEDLDLLSKGQLEMLVSRKDLRDVFQDKAIVDWVKKIVDARNGKEKEAIVQQLLSDPLCSDLIDFVMNELL